MRTFKCLNPVYFFLHEDSYVPHSCHLKLLRIYYNTALGSSHTWEMTFRHEMQKYMWHIACLHLLSFWDNMSSYQVSVLPKSYLKLNLQIWMCQKILRQIGGLRKCATSVSQ